MRALVLYSARVVRTMARGSPSRETKILFLFFGHGQSAAEAWRGTRHRRAPHPTYAGTPMRPLLQLLFRQVVVENQLSTTTRWESQGRLPWAAARSP